MVVRIDAAGGRARAVVLDDGECIEASAVITAVDVQTALLDLLDPPLSGPPAHELAAARRGNAVQLVVHLLTDRLPPYPGARPGDWNGLQRHVGTMEQLPRGFLSAEAHRLPDPPPTYCSTPRWSKRTAKIAAEAGPKIAEYEELLGRALSFSG